jgi:hypothetical protein
MNLSLLNVAWPRATRAHGGKLTVCRPAAALHCWNSVPIAAQFDRSNGRDRRTAHSQKKNKAASLRLRG